MKALIALVLALVLAGCALEPPLKKIPPNQWITLEMKPRGLCSGERDGKTVVWTCVQDSPL